jgi:competence protein ComEC
VAGASTLPVLVNVSTALLIFFIVLMALLFWWRQNYNYLLFTAVFFLFLSLGILRIVFFFENIPVLPGSYIGQSVTLLGKVAGGVEKREGNTRFIIETEEVSGQVLKEKTPVLVFASPETNVSRGQLIRVKGVLKNPETFISSSSQIPFDWPSYLRAKKILYTLSFPQIELVAGKDKTFLSYLDDVKNNFSEKIEKVLPKPEASFLLGVLLGTNPASKDMEESFKKAGLLHVLVLSGYNIAIIIWAVISFFYFLSRPKALVLGMVGAILFTAMVGPTAPLLRAIIMAFCAVVAEFLGGAAVASRTVWLAAFIIVLFSPGVLMFDPSFQLSFLATLGLVYGMPFFKNVSFFKKIPRFIREITAATISAQFFVLPALLFYTGSITPYFLLANALILPLIPIIMFLGFLLVILGFILPFATFLVTMPLFILLKFSLSFISFVASLPGALFFVGSFSGTIIFLLYFALFVVCVQKTEFPPSKGAS